MKKTIVFASAAVLFLLAAVAFTPAVNPELEIGKPLPNADTKMMDVSGKEVSLTDVKGENGLLVMFSCNTCPYVKLSQSRVKELGEFTKQNKVGMILVNSNEAQRSDDDSFEAMKQYAKDQGYTFSYVVDKNSVLANAFGATRTPHCFLFDKTGKLVYRGAIDDNIKDPNDAKEHYLKDAITAIATGKPVKTNSTKSVGCSIKRVEEQ
ncbi:MAG: thiol-disulfide isomerase [Bacteroidetes bacterium]|nr:thiol-disulfide isomerase [Bacteroidota bacterium]